MAQSTVGVGNVQISGNNNLVQLRALFTKGDKSPKAVATTVKQNWMLIVLAVITIGVAIWFGVASSRHDGSIEQTPRTVEPVQGELGIKSVGTASKLTRRSKADAKTVIPRGETASSQSPIDLVRAEAVGRSEGVEDNPDAEVSIGGVVESSYIIVRPDGWITWGIPKRYKTFVTLCGVDDRDDTRYCPKKWYVEVLVDGEVVRRTPVLTGHKPERIVVPLKGGRSLSLRIRAVRGLQLGTVFDELCVVEPKLVAQ